MNTGYLIYQAERPITSAEQRRVDASRAELAASLSRLGHRLTAPLRSVRRTRRQPVSPVSPVSPVPSAPSVPSVPSVPLVSCMDPYPRSSR